jgi:hypothetical protein
LNISPFPVVTKTVTSRIWDPGEVHANFRDPQVDEFLDRLFEHVPVKGLHMVRAYGLYNRSEHAALERCRAHLDPHGLQVPRQLPVPAAEPERCPRCGAALTVMVSRSPVVPWRLSQKPMGPGPPLRLRSN